MKKFKEFSEELNESNSNNSEIIIRYKTGTGFVNDLKDFLKSKNLHVAEFDDRYEDEYPYPTTPDGNILHKNGDGLPDNGVVIIHK